MSEQIKEKTETEKLIERGQKAVMNTYGRLPMGLIRGEGSWVWDVDGCRYLDFVTGLAVNSLGHGHPAVTKAINDQAKLLLHTSNLYWIPQQVELAERLIAKSFADKVFFCNSGAEANEGAIKLARKYAKKHFGEEKYEILSMKNSFHGRTLATLTATGQEKYQQGYDPLPTGFAYAELNNLVDLKKKIGPHTAAVLIEPIQGEGGVYPATQEFLQLARELCQDYGALLIFDEVQCGMGRTGKLFAHEWSGVTPDIMTLAKALGGGVAIGAVLATDKAAEAFQPGDHAATFGGNPLAMAVGCAVMGVMDDDFLFSVQEKSGYFQAKLNDLSQKYGLEPVRGAGFMLGMPVAEAGPEIVEVCRRNGLLINCVGGKTLRFLPPLTVTSDEMDQAALILAKVMEDVLKEG